MLFRRVRYLNQNEIRLHVVDSLNNFIAICPRVAKRATGSKPPDHRKAVALVFGASLGGIQPGKGTGRDPEPNTLWLSCRCVVTMDKHRQRATGNSSSRRDRANYEEGVSHDLYLPDRLRPESTVRQRLASCNSRDDADLVGPTWAFGRLTRRLAGVPRGPGRPPARAGSLSPCGSRH